MTDPYETRRPWEEWDARRDALCDAYGFTDAWEKAMTRRQELTRSITLNQQAVVLLLAVGRSAESAREAIRRARREIWEIESVQCVNW